MAGLPQAAVSGEAGLVERRAWPPTVLGAFVVSAAHSAIARAEVTVGTATDTGPSERSTNHSTKAAATTTAAAPSTSSRSRERRRLAPLPVPLSGSLSEV